MGYIDLTCAPDSTIKILDEMSDGKPYESNGLKIERIYMNGEAVGIGMEVFDLNWNTEITDKNIFDFDMIAKARVLAARIEDVFGKMGLASQVLIFHHLDLGG
jgi:hypothetical protein